MVSVGLMFQWTGFSGTVVSVGLWGALAQSRHVASCEDLPSVRGVWSCLYWQDTETTHTYMAHSHMARTHTHTWHTHTWHAHTHTCTHTHAHTHMHTKNIRWHTHTLTHITHTHYTTTRTLYTFFMSDKSSHSCCLQ